MQGKIFISYRRSDSLWLARALFERLWRSFPDRIFIDLEGIALGVDFSRAIDAHLEGCHVMLAVIGPGWLAQINERLQHEEEDYVRIELARALQRDIPVVPVLVDGAAMPRARQLPDDLKPLVKRNGLDLRGDNFDGQVALVQRAVSGILQAAGAAPAAPAAPVAPSRVPPPPTGPSEAWMHAEGRDECGRWADLKVRGVVQRMRWIEPGEFWMGSTEAERKRFAEGLNEDQKKWLDREKPRHRVRLTQGFWLADTACTQALWRALVGDNPSRFTGDLALPVEKVSWGDIDTQFLPALNAELQGAQAALPTEAQWEYACRAGTDTAYHFGELITPQQVNFDGNYPPPGGSKGDYRERTVPVKALPANAWGLHQMHGNVWEWCADDLRSYEAQPVVDPVGPRSGARRAVRGGSWDFYAWFARCAFRDAGEPAARRNYLGFRFALRSQEPGQ